MTHTYDITTAVGKVRLLCGDTDVTDSTTSNFSDEELAYFLELNNDDLFYAAADVCDALANKLAINQSDILTLGSLTLNKYKPDMLRSQAARLRLSADAAPAFAIAEDNVSGFAEEQILRNYALRTL